MFKILISIFLLLLLFPPFTNAGLGQDLSGQILLDVERNGEAWYVYPNNNKRYYLGRPNDAFQIMRELGLGISEVDFQRIAQAGTPVEGDLYLARQLAGKIIIQVEKNGEAWYIYPKDLKKYYLGRPKDAFQIMRELGLGITRENLAMIHKPGTEESLNVYSKYEYKKINTVAGNFTIDLITINTNNPNLKIITDTANKNDCNSDCPTKTLGEFILKNDGFAGINGTYFESYDKSRLNYYFFPVYNTKEKKMINADQLKYWTTGPIFVWDINNKFYYFKDSREFKSVDEFEKTYNTKIQAAIGNKPRLIENGLNLLIEWGIDDKQKNVKSNRNAIGVKTNYIYLVVARNATVPDLAEIMKSLDVDHALNLDGGYSSTLWYNDEYMVQPGRSIPNAIIFLENNQAK